MEIHSVKYHVAEWERRGGLWGWRCEECGWSDYGYPSEAAARAMSRKHQCGNDETIARPS